MDHKDETICIEIAAYKEFELMNTVHSALLQADYPERIHFAICYQNDDLTDYNELLKIPNCRIKYFKESETKGLCFARYHCQHLIEDETYILQIDGHMRFVKHWDTEMIQQLLHTGDPRGIISFYPENCLEHMMKLPLDDPLFDHPCNACVLYTKSFKPYPSYFLNYSSYPRDHQEKNYLLNPFISGNNFFSFSKVHKEVYNDPNMFFYADEEAMAIRLYTYGWNVYIPNESYIYHQFERKNRKMPPVINEMTIEDERLASLVGVSKHPIDLGEFGLGNVRSLQEYCDFCGVDFQNRQLYMTARTGQYDKEEYKHIVAYSPKEDLTSFKKKIDVILIDLYGEYETCLQSCIEKSAYQNRIHFLIGTISEEEPTSFNKYIKEVIHFPKDSTYCEILSDLSKRVGNSYVAIIDSSYRFIENWDQYYSKNMSDIGEDSALVSWIWYTKSEEKANSMFVYNNIIQKFKGFYDYLPLLCFDESIPLGEREHPYPSMFIPGGFLFCHSKLLKKVPVDPNLDYYEHRIIYATRLWTHGINLYYPPFSYITRVKDDIEMTTQIRHYPVLCYFFQQSKFLEDAIPKDYPYLEGNKRSLWSFYDFIQYDPNQKTS